jgi:hypothetical protein
VNSKNLTKPIILGLIVVGVIIALGIAFYNFVVLASVTMTVPQNAKLTISDLDGKNTQTIDNTKSAQFRVTPGRYMIAAQTNTSRALAYVDASFFSTITKNLELSQVLQAEPLSNGTAYNPLLQNGNLYFVDPTIQHVRRMTPDGTTTSVEDEGVDQDDDNSDAQSGGIYKSQPIGGDKLLVNNFNQLGVIENGTYQQIDTEGIEGLNPLSITLGGNSLQESFVVAVNKTLYFYQNSKAKPQKIADMDKMVNQLAFGGKRVIAYSDSLAYSRENVESAYGNFAINPIVIDIDSKQTYELDGPLVQATVSPGGTYATLQSRKSDTLTTYNLQNRQELYKAARPSLAIPIWINDKEYVYERDKVIWQSNVEQQSNRALGVLLRNATSITTQNGTDFLVTSFTQETDQPKGHVYRLSKQPFASSLIAASETLPISEDNYQIKFINLDQPRLFIETTTSVNNADDPAAMAAKQQQLRNDALRALQANGLNPNDFTITFTP